MCTFIANSPCNDKQSPGVADALESEPVLCTTSYVPLCCTVHQPCWIVVLVHSSHTCNSSTYYYGVPHESA
jgi:hypothetical protein